MKTKTKKIMYHVSSFAIVLLLALVMMNGASAALTIPTQTSMPSSGFSTLLQYVLNFILSILAILGIVGIAVAGVLYITSGGDEKRTESAKKWMLYSIVGIVVALLGYVIVKTIDAVLNTGQGTF